MTTFATLTELLERVRLEDELAGRETRQEAARAYERWYAGATYRAIGEALGITLKQAYLLVRRGRWVTLWRWEQRAAGLNRYALALQPFRYADGRWVTRHCRKCCDGDCSWYRNMNGGCDVCGAPCL